MSWFDPTRRRLIGGVAALVVSAGCGFAPVYTDGGRANALLGRIAIDKVPDRDGFLLRERLRERLGGPATDAPLYRVSMSYAVSSSGLGISQSASITRYNITGIARFTLHDVETREEIFTEEVRAVAGYSTTGSAFAAEVAERDARARLAVTIADKIATRVSLAAEALPQ